jgi:hypothetical protein
MLSELCVVEDAKTVGGLAEIAENLTGERSTRSSAAS